MATYAIGDVQGCFDSLMRLLARIGFDPGCDRLWLVGDLVNRGPRSLEVLRWARDLGDRVTAVLGNHDLHLLMRAAGVAKKKKLDTLDEVLNAPDRDELVDWLRHRPLLYRQDAGGQAKDQERLMVHAGLHPTWDADKAAALAAEVEAVLRAPDWSAHIAGLRGKKPRHWHDGLAGFERLRAIASVLLRARVCTPDGTLANDFSGAPEDAPEGYLPWFAVPDARWRQPGRCVVFGHWAALGLHLEDACMGLDTGCVWGDALTAVRLEDRQIFQVPAMESPDQRP